MATTKKEHRKTSLSTLVIVHLVHRRLADHPREPATGGMAHDQDRRQQAGHGHHASSLERWKPTTTDT
eukprot:556302-Pyramimonas_sp.AAC.1